MQLLMTATKQSQDGTVVPSSLWKRFEAESGWNCSSILTLEAVIKNLHETCQCRMYSERLLMMGKEDARNMQSFIAE